MTDALPASPRALFSRPSPAAVGPAKCLTSEIEDAIAAITSIALTRTSLEDQNDHLNRNIVSLRNEVVSLTQANSEMSRKLADALDSIAMLSHQAASSREQLSEALSRMRMAEQLLDVQRAELNRLLAAVKTAAPPQKQSHVRLIHN